MVTTGLLHVVEAVGFMMWILQNSLTDHVCKGQGTRFEYTTKTNVDLFSPSGLAFTGSLTILANDRVYVMCDLVSVQN